MVDEIFVLGLWSLHYKFMNVIIIWLAKILKNITCGYGHHLWKYWIYHSWPSATRDKSNIFTRDDHNHTWYFPIFFASHILISHCRSTSITTVVHQYYQQNLSEKGQHSTWSGPLIHYWQQLMACSRNLSLPSKQLVFRRWLSVRIPFGLFLWGDHLDA